MNYSRRIYLPNFNIHSQDHNDDDYILETNEGGTQLEAFTRNIFRHELSQYIEKLEFLTVIERRVSTNAIIKVLDVLVTDTDSRAVRK
ncbi:hypothetical protein CRE_15764 [Caenorhabditis remanei]|uniref:Uncharacterized protein n=1 Tax=Caenorhabditis remanei TaxID=31234 RepID=E3NJS0_CAERE|nr:hypothetical protein CRE_15764 [Caenorhabditis remanei]